MPGEIVLAGEVGGVVGREDGVAIVIGEGVGGTVVAHQRAHDYFVIF